MNDIFESNQSQQAQPPLHPRAIRGALERMLEDGRVRVEEPEPLAQFLTEAFMLPERFAPVPLSDIWLDKLWKAESPLTLDQNLRLLLRQASVQRWLGACDSQIP